MVLAAPLRIALWSVILPAICAACSVLNPDHCGNQDGHATCMQRDPAAPFCSVCVADNNGCLAAEPPPTCLADTAPSAASSTTPEPPTTTSTTDTTPVTTTTADPTTTTADTTTTTTTTTTATTTTTDPSSSTGDPSTSTSTGTGTSTGGPFCGNDQVEGDEVCDGSDFNGETCKSVVPGKWGGGSLGCNECMSLNDSDCCVGLAGSCGKLLPDASLPCCGGLDCKLDGFNGYKCESK